MGIFGRSLPAGCITERAYAGSAGRDRKPFAEDRKAIELTFGSGQFHATVTFSLMGRLTGPREVI